MSAQETSSTGKREGAFVLILYVVLFGVCGFVPGKFGGGIAMLAVSIVALPLYILLFRERRGWWQATLAFIAGLALAAGVAVGLLVVFRGHWP